MSFVRSEKDIKIKEEHMNDLLKNKKSGWEEVSEEEKKCHIYFF